MQKTPRPRWKLGRGGACAGMPALMPALCYRDSSWGRKSPEDDAQEGIVIAVVMKPAAHLVPSPGIGRLSWANGRPKVPAVARGSKK
jgi:hypothetical protein